MKAVCVVVALALIPVSARAGDVDPAVVQLWDVVYAADGSVLKGVIVEEVPGVSVRVVIAGGTSIVVQMANVQRFAKELNPSFATGAAPSVAVGGHPARVVTGGVRLGVTPGIAYHSDSDVSTFLITGRAGYELVFDQWGLTPGVVAEFLPGAGNYDANGGAILGGLRAAYRGASVSPFVGFGLGLDVVGTDTSLGTFTGAGIDLLVHPRIALSAEVKYHRGWAGTYVQSMSWVGAGMGLEVRL